MKSAFFQVGKIPVFLELVKNLAYSLYVWLA